MKFVDLTSVDGYDNPIDGKTYISPPINNNFSNGKGIRIVTRGWDTNESYEIAKVKGEIILRQTTGGKNKITAKIIEKNNRINVLNIQQYTAASGNPHKLGFAFIGDEISKLYNFIRDVQVMQFGSQKFQRLSDEDIEHIVVTDKQAAKLFLENQEVFANIARSEITSKDIVAYGYRRKQLSVFEKLLFDSTFFENALKAKNISNERLWQRYFEKNQWIFGYGLGYVFLTGLDDKKLEQVVRGYDIANRGKRVDALMKTRGLISNLCFVEIKTHTTMLLDNKSKAYRPDCFAISDELSGAIAQIQGTVESATRNLASKISIKDDSGAPTGEDIYNFHPKSFLVVGSLGEFNAEHGVNEAKLRSFELFRKNIAVPEIITFDELYERARFIVNYSESIGEDEK